MGIGTNRPSVRRARRTGILLVVLGLLVPLVALIAPSAVQAAPKVPFDVRFQADDNGAIALFGNNLMTCPASDTRCAGARAGTNVVNNNDFVMTMLDVDGDPSTFNSSSTVVTLPPDSTVLWAGLYWGARLSKGDGGVAATTPSSQMRFRVPGGAYQTVTTDSTFGPTAGDAAYQQFAEVTGLVRAAGSGPYWGANVAAGTGKDRYAGWSLVVVVRDPTAPLRNLTVFDGFDDVGRDNPQTITISGFRTPVQGPVDTQLGFVAYEGDRGSSGDQARLNQTQLSTPASPGSNFFNSSNDDRGRNVTTRDPADLSMLGFDIMRLDTSGIGNNATSATISLSSTGDRYFPGVVTTAIGLYAPDFSTSTKTVTDLAGNDPADPGDEMEYAVTFANTGQDPASNSVSTDPIPAGTAYLPGSLRVETGPNAGPKSDGPGDDQAEFVPGSDSVRFRLGTGASSSAGGIIGVGVATTFTFHVVVQPGAAGTTITNAAPLDYVGASLNRPFTYAVPPASIAVRQVADLSITKDTTPDPVVAGSTAVSRLTVHNVGPSPAEAVQVVDRLPDGVTFVSATTPQGSCPEAAGEVTCDLGTVASGATVVVQVTFRVPTSSDVDTVANTASVSSPTADPNLTDNAAGSSVAAVQQADLSVTKRVVDATLVPGQQTQVEVTVTNKGPSDARSVVVTDQQVDPGLKVLSATLTGATCTVVEVEASCSLPTLAAGQSRVMTMTVQLAPDVAAGEVFTDIGRAGSVTPDPVAGNDSATGSVTAQTPLADLVVTKDAAATATAGETVSYSVTVANNGPSTARSVSLDDLLPPGLTATSVTTTSGSCTGTTDVTCDLGDIAGPVGGQMGTVTISVTAQIPPGQPTGSLTNTARVSSPTADPTPANRSATATTTIKTVADVSVTKTADPLTPTPGGEVTYTVTVRNDGPSEARAVVLTDDLPNEFDLAGVTAPAGTSCVEGDPLVCTVGDVPVDATRVFTVRMTIPPDLVVLGDYPNMVTVTAAGTDPAPGNNQAIATVSTRPISDLIMVKRITSPTGDDPLPAGSEVTYLLGVGNFGPSAAATARVTDVLPPGVTYVSSTQECTYAAATRTLSCDIPDVPVDLAAVFPVVVRLDADLDNGTLLTNSATVTLTDPARVDPDTSNNTATVSRPVETQADLKLTKTGAHLEFPSFTVVAPADTPPGGILSFGIEVRNDGPSVARDVMVVDELSTPDFVPTQIRLARSDGTIEDLTDVCTVLDQKVDCPLGDLPVFTAGQTAYRIQLDGVVLSSATPGGYTNTATATSSTSEQNAADNTAQVPVNILAPVATLAVDKTSVDTELVAGGTFEYTISVANVLDLTREGASDAPDTVLTDTLPAGLTATDVSTPQGTCTITGQTVRCELGTVLGPGRVVEPTPILVRVSGTVSPDARGTLSNSAVADSPISDPATDSISLPVRSESDLSVVKSADSETTPAGGTVGYSIVVTNAGPSSASGVELQDVLPSQLTVDPDQTDPVCLPVATPLACTIGTLGVGDSRTIRVSGTLPPDLPPGPLTNTARLAPRPDDPNPDDNTSTVTTQTTREANLALVKTTDVESAPVGSTVTFNLSATNSGPSDATDVVVTDTLPAGTTVDTVSGDPPLSCTTDGSSVRCTAPTLAAGASAAASVEVTINESREPGQVVNRATVTSSATDPDLSDNDAQAQVTAFIEADTVITKTLLTPDPVVGQPLEFALDVVNNGPQASPDTVVSDGLPPELTFVAATAVGGPPCTMTNPEGTEIVTCTLGELAVGQTARVIVRVLPTEAVTTLTNVGAVGSRAIDPKGADNVSDVTFAVSPAPITPTTPPTSTTTAPPTTQPTTPPASTSPPPPSEGGSGLSFTGATVIPYLLGGALLVLLGTGLVAWATSRRREPATH